MKAVASELMRPGSIARNGRGERLLWLKLFVLATAPPTLAQVATPTAAPAVQRPPFQFLRQDEDWSNFRASGTGADLFDGPKHIPLSDDGDVWVSFGGRVESRLESWVNFASVDANDDSFVLTKGFGHADLHVGDRLRFFVEGKSSQATDRGLPGGRRTTDLDTLEFQQLFFDLEVPFGDGVLRVRPGRQALLLGAQRLISPLGWANTQRTWDGVTAEWRVGDWTITGLATAFVPVDKTRTNKTDRDNTLFGLYARHAVKGAKEGFEFYALGSERKRVTFNGTSGDEERLTFGGRRWAPLPERLDYEVEVAWQTGEIGDGDVQAWMVSSQLGWRPEGLPGGPRLFIGLDAASGDETPGGDVGTFDQLFPLGHAYLGFIDTIGRQNILAYSAGGKWAVTPKTVLSVTVHHFQVMETEDALYNAGSAAIRTGFDSRTVGSEVDLLAEHNFDHRAQGYAGYSHFFSGNTLAETGASENTDFLYLGLRYTF